MIYSIHPPGSRRGRGFPLGGGAPAKKRPPMRSKKNKRRPMKKIQGGKAFRYFAKHQLNETGMCAVSSIF